MKYIRIALLLLAVLAGIRSAGAWTGFLPARLSGANPCYSDVSAGCANPTRLICSAIGCSDDDPCTQKVFNRYPGILVVYCGCKSQPPEDPQSNPEWGCAFSAEGVAPGGAFTPVCYNNDNPGTGADRCPGGDCVLSSYPDPDHPSTLCYRCTCQSQ